MKGLIMHPLTTRGLLALAATAALALVACRNTTGQVGPEALALRAGDERRLSGSSVIVGMLRLVEDSRCPADARCIWAGNAAVSVRVRTANGLATTYQLNTTAEPKSITAMGYDVRLDSLLRVPGPGPSSAPGAYVAYITTAPVKP